MVLYEVSTIVYVTQSEQILDEPKAKAKKSPDLSRCATAWRLFSKSKNTLSFPFVLQTEPGTMQKGEETPHVG